MKIRSVIGNWLRFDIIISQVNQYFHDNDKIWKSVKHKILREPDLIWYGIKIMTFDNFAKYPWNLLINQAKNTLQ